MSAILPGAMSEVGCTLRRALDEAVAGARGSDERTAARVRTVLADFVREYAGEVPERFTHALEGRYARRLLLHSETPGYSVVVMTWGPGQGTPIHDHCGMWCVEGVWSGCIEVVQYECLERRDERWRFEPRGCVQACAGSAGSLVPPHEYHTIANPSSGDVAVTVHVYRGRMTHCNVFEPAEATPDAAPAAPGSAAWYRRRARELAFD